MAIVLAVFVLQSACNGRVDIPGTQGTPGGGGLPPAGQCAAPLSTPTADPATTDSLYPTPRYLGLGNYAASAKTVCISTSALGSHKLLDQVIPSLVQTAGLSMGTSGTCACDWQLTFTTAAPSFSGPAAQAWSSASGSPEGFALSTSVTGGRALTTLVATQENSALMALRMAFSTARQNANDSKMVDVPEGEIVDWPTFNWRGIVEGIYGTPYSIHDRAEILQLLSELKGNVYIYSPKNDGYTRAQWRTPYPFNGPAQRIQMAVHQAEENQIKFIWGISPNGSPNVAGSGFNYSNFNAEFTTLKAKLDSVRALGVKHFAVFIDDSSDGVDTDHAKLINAIDDYLKSIDPTHHLITVTVHYYGGPDAYSNYMGSTLHPDIEVMWTGTAVEPSTMSAGDMTGINASLQRKVTIWDNWPNTPGSFTGRSADLSTAVQGYYANPVLNENSAHPTETFLQVLGPIADYLWDSANYTAGDSFNKWQTLLSSWEPACQPCGNISGFTCDPSDTNAIYYCDGQCLIRSTCPGGCQKQPNPQPDVCN